MPKYYFAFFVFLFLNGFLSAQCRAPVQNQLDLADGIQDFSLAGHLFIYHGRAQEQTPNQIIQDSSHFHLYDRSKDLIQFTEGQNTYWIRFKIKNNFSFDKEFVLFLNRRWDTINVD
jgi:hypothetical protein